MTELILACLAFVFLHLGVSATPLRGVLVSALGDKGYLGAYSLAAFGSLGAMIYTYGVLPHTDFIWLPSSLAFSMAKVLMLLAIIFIVMGTLTRNPTSVGQETAAGEALTGIIKVTRHPTQVGIMLFCIGHLLANGDKASIVLFGSVLLVSIAGVVSMDARKRSLPGDQWQRFFAQTTVVPFSASLQGRNVLRASDFNWTSLIVAVALYGSIYWLHDMVSGGASLF